MTLIRKELVIVIVLLFIGTFVISAIAQDTGNPLHTSRGDSLYVGGSGPGNYTKIQEAINDSHDGDTVFVYSGVYSERIVIPKAISLIGESKNTTVIDAINSDVGDLIFLKSDNITISGFTLRFNGDWGNPRVIISNINYHEGTKNITISDNILQADVSFPCICLYRCDFCTITQNIFYLHNYSDGIALSWGNNCTITNNLINTVDIGNGTLGIVLSGISYSTISNNSIISNRLGCSLTYSKFNIISHNHFYRNNVAINIESSENNSIISNHIENAIYTPGRNPAVIGIRVMDNSMHNIIEKNFISHFMFGVFIEKSYGTVISMNTFMKNIFHARFSDTKFSSGTIWNENYWGRPRILPKPIFGIKNIYYGYPGFIEFDWHPAQEPYNFTRMT
jgi:parallel beta-helix repeat protein